MHEGLVRLKKQQEKEKKRDFVALSLSFVHSHKQVSAFNFVAAAAAAAAEKKKGLENVRVFCFAPPAVHTGSVTAFLRISVSTFLIIFDAL